MSAQRSVGVYQPRSRRAQIAEALADCGSAPMHFSPPQLWRVLGGGLLVIAAALLVGWPAMTPPIPVSTSRQARMRRTGWEAWRVYRRFHVAVLGPCGTGICGRDERLGLADVVAGHAATAVRLARSGAVFWPAVLRLWLGRIALVRLIPGRRGRHSGTAVLDGIEITVGTLRHWHWLPLASSIALGLCGLALVLWAAGANFRTAGIIAGGAGYGVTTIFRALGAMRGRKPAIRRPVFEPDDDDDDEFEEAEVDDVRRNRRAGCCVRGRGAKPMRRWCAAAMSAGANPA